MHPLDAEPRARRAVGRDAQTERWIPVQVPGLTDVVAIAASVFAPQQDLRVVDRVRPVCSVREMGVAPVHINEPIWIR